MKKKSVPLYALRLRGWQIKSLHAFQFGQLESLKKVKEMLIKTQMEYYVMVVHYQDAARHSEEIPLVNR